MSRRLVLLRHGQSAYNVEGRFQGQRDIELTEVGREQARAAAQRLAGLPVGRVVSSDLQRASETARIVAERHGVEVEVTPRLRETNVGVFEGLTRSEIDARWPGARARWRTDVTWAPEGAENHIEVGRRARPVVDELMDSFDEWDDSCVVLVGHGGVSLALASNLLGLAVEQLPLFGRLGNCCTGELSARPRLDADRFDAVSAGRDDLPEPVFTLETVGRARWMVESWNVAPGPVSPWESPR